VHFHDSPIDCQSNNTACDAHGDSLIESFPGVETILECRELCTDSPNSGCEFITYFGSTGFPLKNFCQLFRSCETTVNCNGCISEARGCFGACSSNVVGAIEDNYVDYIPNVSSESGCINECRSASGCNYYTYYLEDDPNSGVCILLSSIIEPIEECATCVTGPIDCEAECGFIYDGKKENHMMFTDPGVDIVFHTDSSLNLCQLRVLAVGGGGSVWNGGGGSGYIQYFSQTLTSTSTTIRLAVGDGGQASNVTIDSHQIEASPGNNGGFDGGDGYSGGGGGKYEPCDGGSNGEDGDCSDGGKGTGEDVASYTFNNYKLSPGERGRYYTRSDGFYSGGGGGGVLINGAGPPVRFHKSGTKWSDGEGYGAGGTYHGESITYGNSGVILVEVVGGY